MNYLARVRALEPRGSGISHANERFYSSCTGVEGMKKKELMSVIIKIKIIVHVRRSLQ